MSKIQRISTLQVVSELVENIADIKSEENVSVYRSKEICFGEYETFEILEKLKKCNSGNFLQQKNASVNDCNGENASNPELPGSRKYFRKLGGICWGKELEQLIN